MAKVHSNPMLAGFSFFGTYILFLCGHSFMSSNVTNVILRILALKERNQMHLFNFCGICCFSEWNWTWICRWVWCFDGLFLALSTYSSTEAGRLKLTLKVRAGGGYKNVLVVGADALSRYVDWTDRGTCILFGDASGALVLQVWLQFLLS
jgi:hypothetical protein